MYQPELKICPICADKLIKKYNTAKKTVITLKEKMECGERVLKCRNSKCKGSLMSFHSAEFKALTLEDMTFGIDVVALEGELRFEEHKTIEEIVNNLKGQGVNTNGATVSKHLDRYLALISGYQQEKVEAIRQAIAKQGGYVLQIDGTVSVKTKTLYIFRDNVSGTTLYAALADQDNTDSVKPLFQYVKDKFGIPLAIMSDMQKAFIESAAEVFPGVPHQFCQYHFLKNVGNAILKEKHQQLGKLIRQKEVKTEIVKIQNQVETRKKDDKLAEVIFAFCCMLLNVTTMQAPFELYYLEIYNRYWEIRTAIRKCIKMCSSEIEQLKFLFELDELLTSVLADESIKMLVKELKNYYHYFKRLCDILKDVKDKGKEVREQVEKKARRFLAEMKTKSKTDPEFKKVVTRLEKFWCGLFYTYEFNYIPSTNNELESYIKDFKRVWKRITGFYNVNRWISFHGPFAVYLFNFRKNVDDKSPFEILGLQIPAITVIFREVSIETFKNERVKQMELRESYRLRLIVNQIGVKEYLGSLVKDFENEIENIKRS